MLMCKHRSEALLIQFQSVCHSSKNQHAELTRAALMQCARGSQFIHHTRQFAESSESSWAELVSLVLVYCVYVFVYSLFDLNSPRPLFHKEWGTVNSCSSDSLPKSIEQADLGCTDTPPHRCTGPTSGLQRLSDAKASTKVCRPAQPILLL